MLLRRDDHVLVSTRLIALVIIPFLLGAFVILYCFPRHSARLFAWPIKPTMTSMMLSCRVIGAIFCLGGSGLAVFTDSRWSTVELLLQVEMIMVTLMLVAAVRAVSEFDPHKALTWLLGGGFIAILAGSVYLWVVMTARARRRSVPGRSGESEDAGLLQKG